MAEQLISQTAKKILPPQGVRRILIRGTNWIGDAVLTLAALSAVRNSYPGARIFILVKPWVADIFRLCPLVDEIIVYESPGIHEGIGGKLRLAGQLRSYEFDMAILLQNAFEAALLARLAGIPVRAGYNTDARGLLLTHAVPMRRELKKIHQAEYYLQMVQALGCGGPEKGPFLRLTAEDEKKAETLLRTFGLQEQDLIIGMAPGATYGPAKKWRPARFGALAEKLAVEFGAQTLLFGSAGDRETAKEVQRCSRYPLIDLAGGTDLRTAVALMARCRLFISNDSGLMHVAGALNLPTIALFGSTNPVATAPIGERNIIVYHGVECSPCLRETCPTDFRCLDGVTTEEVFDIAKGVLCR